MVTFRGSGLEELDCGGKDMGAFDFAQPLSSILRDTVIRQQPAVDGIWQFWKVGPQLVDVLLCCGSDQG